MHNRYTIQLFLILTLLLFCPIGSIATENNIKLSDSCEVSLTQEERRKFDHFFYEALNAKAQGKYDEAMDLFRYCHALDSTNANVLVELGTFYNVLQEKDKALTYLQKAVAHDPSNYYYNMMLAGLSKELDRKQDVVDIYTAMHERYPDKQELLYELASAHADNGELQQAIDMLDQLEKSTGIIETVTMSKFRYYSMLEQKEEAFEEIEQIIEKNPSNPAYLVLMGDLYMEDNQSEKAWEYYERAYKVDASFPALILSRINYYEKNNRKRKAQEELEAAITGSSMDAETKVQLLTRYLGILQQEQQDLAQANPLFESLFKQYPNYSRLRMIYGNVLLMQDDKKGAMKQFREYITEQPDDPAGYEQIIRIALPEEDMETLKSITEEGIKNIPQEPQFYFYLGAAHYQEENHEEALRVFKEGLEHAVIENPLLESDFHGQIGDINFFLGHKEEAFKSYEKALQLNPQNLPVLNNYSYYLSLDKRDLDKAEMMSGLTIKAEPMNPTYLDTYGWILFEQGSYIMAKIYLEKAVEYSGENPSAEVLEHYGDLLHKTGEKEKAVEQWIRARELGGDAEALDRKIKNITNPTL